MTATARTLYCAIAAVICVAGAGAQSYPTKPIRMIVSLPPATATDVVARTVGAALGDAYKQQVVTDNRPGAGGLIGSTLLTKAVPDGYTLAMISPPHVASPLLQSRPPYHPIDDVAPVIVVASMPNVIVVAPNVPAKNLRELVSVVKSRPGEFNFGSLGVGTGGYLGAEILNFVARLKAVHVAFKELGSLNAEMSAGRVHYFLPTTVSSLALLTPGSKLRGIAVTTKKRSALLPELPTISEAGFPEAESSLWFGIIAPAGTPRPIVSKLNADVLKALGQPKIRETLERLDAQIADDTTPEAFASLLRAEYSRYQTLYKELGLKPN